MEQLATKSPPGTRDEEGTEREKKRRERIEDYNMT
jgi:hypothetical protein